jgi:hypothetical protein
MFCKVKFNPRRINGIGQVDGECVERFWAWARHFAPITKEMTPSHRVNLLTDAFLYYGGRKADSISENYYLLYNVKGPENIIGLQQH